MEQNPYEAPTSETGLKSTLGLTVRRLIAIAFWLLAIGVVTIFIVIVEEMTRKRQSMPPIFGVGTAVTFALPAVGTALLGYSVWKGSRILAALGIAALLPLAYSLWRIGLR